MHANACQCIQKPPALRQTLRHLTDGVPGTCSYSNQVSLVLTSLVFSPEHESLTIISQRCVLLGRCSSSCAWGLRWCICPETITLQFRLVEDVALQSLLDNPSIKCLNSKQFPNMPHITTMRLCRSLAVHACRESARNGNVRDIDVSWEKRDTSREKRDTSSSSSSRSSSSTANRMPPPSAPPLPSPSSSSTPPSAWDQSKQSAGVSSRPRPADSSRPAQATSSSGTLSQVPGWWQIGDKVYQRLTGRSDDHEPTQPSDGGLSAAHQAEMILQLILDQQRQNAPLQVSGCFCWVLGHRFLLVQLVFEAEASYWSIPSKNLYCFLHSSPWLCFSCGFSTTVTQLVAPMKQKPAKCAAAC